LAVKIIRQANKIALLGSPSSAAALRPGHERAPEALRAAGLADRLQSAGFEVADLGDTSQHVFQADDEHPRARNVPGVLKALRDLRPRVEVAVKSGALPLILCGDCVSVLATIAGVRRYYRNVRLIYMDRDADLNVPATTPSGCVDGMVISHVIGRGAPELIRFWGEPPLVREPDVALFGLERLDPGEEQYLTTSPLQRHTSLEISTIGAATAARAALERVHASNHEFVLHFDVDVIAGEQFRATNFPGEGGLSWNEVRDALRVFAAQPNLAAIEVAAYNPDLDPDGDDARRLVDLLVEVLAPRLKAEVVGTAGTETVPAPLGVEPATAAPEPAPPETQPEEAEPSAAASEPAPPEMQPEGAEPATAAPEPAPPESQPEGAEPDANPAEDSKDSSDSDPASS
jgi:arginase